MSQDSEELTDIGRLEVTAAELKKKMADVMPRRPVVIEFCGSPRSGKTQSINSLSVFLRRNKFRVATVVEQAGLNPMPNKFDPAFNVWNGCSSLCRLLETIVSKVEEYDFILIDRGIFDTVCWFYFQLNRGVMPVSEYEAFTNFFLNEKWTSLTTLVYIFTAKPEASLQREYATLLTRKEGSVMRDNILSQYNMAITGAFEEHGDKFSRTARLDTSELDQNKVGYVVTSQVLEILDDVLQERIAYFKSSEIKIPSEEMYFDFGRFARDTPQINFEHRVAVENDALVTQPVAIALIKDTNENKVLVGIKAKRLLRQNSPERDKTLFWFGGHVRKEDTHGKNGDDRAVISILKEALRREIKEELDLDVAINSEPTICIWDKTSESGRKHLAFVFVLEMDFRTLNYRVDNKEFGLTSVRPLTFDEYKSSPSIRVDSWSHAILLKVLKWHIGPLFEQTEFNFL
jgi:predicted NUDIX family phosphoesterase